MFFSRYSGAHAHCPASLLRAAVSGHRGAMLGCLSLHCALFMSSFIFLDMQERRYLLDLAHKTIIKHDEAMVCQSVPSNVRHFPDDISATAPEHGFIFQGNRGELATQSVVAHNVVQRIVPGNGANDTNGRSVF